MRERQGASDQVSARFYAPGYPSWTSIPSCGLQPDGLPRAAVRAVAIDRTRLAQRFIGLVEGFLTPLPAERPKQTPLSSFSLLGDWREKAAYRTGADMKEKTQTSSEPSWLDPRNDRKTPFTDAELNVLADDFIASMADTQAWQNLVTEVGEQRAREVVKQRLAAQDPNSLINWQPDGPLH